MPITDHSKSSQSPRLVPRPNTSTNITRSTGKSITTSVPSIAVRFHSGDEELDIYPSADDEDEGEKDDVRSISSTTAATCPTPPSNASPSVLSRDPSPMKEYLKGLGKRSTSVDAGIMDVGSSGSDTWRIFHELKGKITKTVEEKLTEIKSDRRSGTPLFSGKSSTRPGRLRAGGNSQDNSSISDSEDISENSNKEEQKSIGLSTTQDPTLNASMPSSNTSVEKSVKFICDAEDVEIPTTSFDNDTFPETPGHVSKKKGKKGKKSTLRNRKGNTNGMTSFQENILDSDEMETLDEDIESGVEVSEETKFVPDIDYGDIPIVDFRVSPPITHAPSFIDVRRQSRMTILEPTSSSSIHILTKAWSYRIIIASVAVLVLLLALPLPPYISGLIAGILITMFYHVTVGMANWYMPSDLPDPKAFQIPHYMEMSILETAQEEDIFENFKFGGWMNELSDTYDPDTYHINNTHSVYIQLDGSTLRVSHPKSKIPKRALWNERKHKLKFTHQRIYDISGCSIKLLPEGITRKRRWSKKYPLCVMLTTEAKKRQSHVLPARDDTRILETMPSEPDESENTSPDDPPLSGLVGDVDEVILDEDLKILAKTDSSETSLGSKVSAVSEVDDNDNEDEVSICSKLSTDKTTLGLPDDDEPYAEPLLELSEPLDLSDDDTFCLIDEPLEPETCLYLFSRTDREKEEWYRRFVLAIKTNLIPCDDELELPSGSKDLDSINSQKTSAALPEVSLKAPKEYVLDEKNFSKVDFIAPSALVHANKDYVAFMNRFHLQHNRDKRAEKVAGVMKLDREVDCDVMWVNALLGRILYDVLRNPHWISKFQEKIQKKLATIKLPYFVEELILTNIDLGRDVPMIHRASRPVLDDHGLWVDLDITFEGSIILTVETKLNLMKLKKVTNQPMVPNESTEEHPPTETEGTPEKTPEKCKSPIYDSSLEDSAESSPTESEDSKGQSSSEDTSSSKPAVPLLIDSIVAPSPSDKKKPAAVGGKGVIRMMNKFVASQFFQNATEYKYIKRAMEGVSNTRIVFIVEIKACTGQLAVNLPPPPSDRLWYGFRGNPRLWLSVKPKFGQRQVNITYVTNWLEKKLIHEFRKKVVLPNMDDLVIPPMTTDLPE